MLRVGDLVRINPKMFKWFKAETKVEVRKHIFKIISVHPVWKHYEKGKCLKSTQCISVDKAHCFSAEDVPVYNLAVEWFLFVRRPKVRSYDRAPWTEKVSPA